VVKDAMNVRQTEGLVARLQRARTHKAHTSSGLQSDAHISSLEARIRDRMGTKVRLSYKGGKGTVQLAFFSDDELERILELLGVKAE
jgi:ParB family chromosome partitioning protein